MKRTALHCLSSVVLATAAAVGSAMTPQVKTVSVVPEENNISVEIVSDAPITPEIKVLGNPARIVMGYPHVDFAPGPRDFAVNRNGVKQVRVTTHAPDPTMSLITIDLDSLRPYGIRIEENKFILTLLQPAGEVNRNADPAAKNASDSTPGAAGAPSISSSLQSAVPEVEHPPTGDAIAVLAMQGLALETHPAPPRSYRVKYIAGRTAYIDGGSNSGLRIGMHLAVHPNPIVVQEKDGRDIASPALLRVIGIATTSAITQVDAGESDVKLGDIAILDKQDAEVAARNSANPPGKQPVIEMDDEEMPSSPTGSPQTSIVAAKGNSLRSTAGSKYDVAPRMAGRIGLDASGITSAGSTPGQSLQMGMSFQSDMTHIMGTHWNLQGYWRGRINRHSQFQAEPANEVLNKTYTMQLYYDNPNSNWVAGVGRLYLPWAVSLDTIDGGYLGHKFFGKMTTGVFAGSTPDLNSWHYRPDQRIGGAFANFEGGDYEGFHYSSTSGVALSSVKWRLDRPFAFFENEASYKGKISIYHSLIADAPRGISTPGWKPGVGISHSYFAAHYQPKRVISLDLYHNYFRDAPTAQTRVVGSGTVDNLLFQGLSGGIHLRPSRYVTLYTTLGVSSKTGDESRSLNRMYGATWNEILHTGLRADFHLTKFESNFGDGNYRFLSLSRQLSNRMFWNVALGDQKLITEYSRDFSSKFLANSVDINIGRHSYLQSGYTYVNGASMNYRQWYLSWGFRLDKGKENPEYVQTLNPTH